MENAKIPMVLFGVIAVVAVVGLVLMFVQGQASSMAVVGAQVSNQPGWYTNYDQSQYPYWATQQPPNIPAGSIQNDPSSKVPGDWYGVVNTQRQVSYVPGLEKRNPEGNIPSPLMSCGRGYIQLSWQEAQGKIGNPNWDCTPIEKYVKGGPTGEIDIGKAGYVCCAPKGPMVDGYIGSSKTDLV